MIIVEMCLMCVSEGLMLCGLLMLKVMLGMSMWLKNFLSIVGMLKY